jgi:hypothetical protein
MNQAKRRMRWDKPARPPSHDKLIGRHESGCAGHFGPDEPSSADGLVMGDWGAPLEHAGDSPHALGAAESNLLGAGGDILSGDVDGALHALGDTGGDVEADGQGIVAQSL